MTFIQKLKNPYYYFNKFNVLLQRKTENLNSLMFLFSCVGVLNFPIFFVVWSFLDQEGFSEFYPRLISTILWLFLLIKNYWPKKLQKFLSLYWYLTILYTLPFFGTYLFLKSHASQLWVNNIVIGLIWLVLVTDWISFAILLPLGMILGVIFYHFAVGEIYLVNEDLTGAISNYIWAVIIATLFSHKKDQVQAEKLKGMYSLSASIAHELRTPLGSIALGIKGLKKHLPSLIGGYESVQKTNLSIHPINRTSIKKLKAIPVNIERQVSASFTFIEMLLIMMRQVSVPQISHEICSIYDCIKEALDRYPLHLDEKQIIHWDIQNDFKFKGNKLLLIHILFNLLKNSLHYTKVAGKGEIYIWTENKKKTNRLHFKDTGTGISAKILPHIFDRFYSKTIHGTGLGLYFCKTAMQGINGDIECHSKEEEYAEFILSFPKLS